MVYFGLAHFEAIIWFAVFHHYASTVLNAALFFAYLVHGLVETAKKKVVKEHGRGAFLAGAGFGLTAVLTLCCSFCSIGQYNRVRKPSSAGGFNK